MLDVVRRVEREWRAYRAILRGSKLFFYKITSDLHCNASIVERNLPSNRFLEIQKYRIKCAEKVLQRLVSKDFKKFDVAQLKVDEIILMQQFRFHHLLSFVLLFPTHLCLLVETEENVAGSGQNVGEHFTTTATANKVREMESGKAAALFSHRRKPSKLISRLFKLSLRKRPNGNVSAPQLPVHAENSSPPSALSNSSTVTLPPSSFLLPPPLFTLTLLLPIQELRVKVLNKASLLDLNGIRLESPPDSPAPFLHPTAHLPPPPQLLDALEIDVSNSLTLLQAIESLKASTTTTLPTPINRAVNSTTQVTLPSVDSTIISSANNSPSETTPDHGTETQPNHQTVDTRQFTVSTESQRELRAESASEGDSTPHPAFGRISSRASLPSPPLPPPLIPQQQHPSLVIFLLHAKACEVLNGTSEQVFSIASDDFRELLLRADSQVEMSAWIQAINAAAEFGSLAMEAGVELRVKRFSAHQKAPRPSSFLGSPPSIPLATLTDFQLEPSVLPEESSSTPASNANTQATLRRASGEELGDTTTPIPPSYLSAPFKHRISQSITNLFLRREPGSVQPPSSQHQPAPPRVFGVSLESLLLMEMAESELTNPTQGSRPSRPRSLFLFLRIKRPPEFMSSGNLPPSSPPPPNVYSSLISVDTNQSNNVTQVWTLKNSIPIIFKKCLDEVEMRGLTEVGLYRISGTNSVVKELKSLFESSSPSPFLFNSIDVFL